MQMLLSSFPACILSLVLPVTSTIRFPCQNYKISLVHNEVLTCTCLGSSVKCDNIDYEAQL